MTAATTADSLNTGVQQLYGLTVAATFPLHQDRAAVTSDPADVAVVERGAIDRTSATPEGEVLLDFGDPPDRWYSAVRRADGTVLLRVYGVCDFELSADLRTVHLHVVHGTAPGMRAIMTTGTLLALQLYLRGTTVLHASAVEQGGRAIGFIGHSGMGKSTLAALMCAAGARLVTDDVLPVTAGSAPRVRLGATELRLRPGTEVLAMDFAPEACRQRRSADDRHVLSLAADAADDVPLTALVVPRPNRDGRLEMELLDRKSALFAIMSFPRLMGWRDPAILAEQFEQASRLAVTVPVIVAHVPWGPPFRQDTAEQIWAAVDRHAHRAVPAQSSARVSR